MGWQSKFFTHREVPCTCKVLSSDSSQVYAGSSLAQCPALSPMFQPPHRDGGPRGAVLGPALASSGEPQAGRSE